MHLVEIRAKNFRCLKDVKLSVQRFTTLIGENDSGKSSLLDLIDLVLNGKQPDENDFCQEEDDVPSSDIEVELTFEVKNAASSPAQDYVAMDGKLHVRRIFSSSSSSTYYLGQKFTDERLNQSFTSLKAGEFDELLEELGITYNGEGRLNQEKRLRLIDDYKQQSEVTEAWVEEKLASILDLLPRFERYSALDYKDPASLVLKTLQTVYEDALFEIAQDGQKRPVEALRQLKSDVEVRINGKVKELLAFVQQYNQRVKQISFDPTIDFSRGLRTGEFLLDDGKGLHYLSKKGDGTKRRMFMATLDWDRHILSARDDSARTIIRGYDEPDANLHYEAQRRMYNTIADVTQQDGVKIQAIVCTHSLTMIDRAPATSIRLLSLSEVGYTKISSIETDDDPEVEEFLHLLASELGITNTMIFYERCYIVIEGATEENALPVLYRRMYGRSMIDDGIRLINIEGKGGRKGLLKLLGKNRQKITLSLLDPDNEIVNEYRDAGFNEDHIRGNVFYVGAHEFEDAFSDEDLCTCFDEVWPRVDGDPWKSEHLQPLRAQAENRKFSDALLGLVYQSAMEGPACKKPILGMEIAKRCSPERIPEPICCLFERARVIAGM